MEWRYIFILTIVIFSCTTEKSQPSSDLTREIVRVEWVEVDSIDIQAYNSDIKSGTLTMDIGIYFPSNLDSKFDKVTLSRVMQSFEFAKEIYRPTGVQFNLLWVKTGKVDPRYFSIQANEVPGIPQTEYANMYEHSRRHPAVLTELAKEAFQSIIEPAQNGDRTIYLVVLQDVFYPFLEVSEGRNWTMKSVRTGGLSFPTYSYVGTIDPAYRGVITLTNLKRKDRFRKTIAHELGHKVMNVSHEYKSTNPGHEVYDNGGLMLYGEGEDIPVGQEGRWHQERLLISPFLYRLDENGIKNWNPDYKEGGHYYDPIYGDKVIRFEANSVIDEDW
ncbi:hypothetical protein [Ekhidna sp.]|uniref:hypothetical protein n=1 Tax=Ekhidna sp. TaxID=2608089 RepID=UPI003299D0C0